MRLEVLIPHVRGQGRPRAVVRGKHAGVYTHKDDGAYRGEVVYLTRLAMDAQGLTEPMDGPLRLTLDVFYARPKSVSFKRRPLPTVKPDLSNIIKAIEDALNGVAIVDDAAIVELVASKVYGPSPLVRVLVESIGLARPVQ